MAWVKCGLQSADLWILEPVKCRSNCESMSTIYPLKATFNELCTKTISVQVPHATKTANNGCIQKCTYAKLQSNSKATGNGIIWKMGLITIVFPL